MDYILIYCYFYGLLNLVRNKKKFFIPLPLHSSQHRRGEREVLLSHLVCLRRAKSNNNIILAWNLNISSFLVTLMSCCLSNFCAGKTSSLLLMFVSRYFFIFQHNFYLLLSESVSKTQAQQQETSSAVAAAELRGVFQVLQSNKYFFMHFPYETSISSCCLPSFSRQLTTRTLIKCAALPPLPPKMNLLCEM